MSQYLFPYIKECIDAGITQLCKKIPENEANILRGYISALKEIVSMQDIIKARMNVERDEHYKSIMQASLQKEPN